MYSLASSTQEQNADLSFIGPKNISLANASSVFVSDIVLENTSKELFVFNSPKP